ncbi:MAG: ArsR family transcriptional regulator [Planctomycetales bacterium]
MSALKEVTNRLVMHWGEMARSWGISKTMGQVHALLYVSGREWSAEEIMEELEISRGNASMSLRELVNWGLVSRIHHRGERRDFYAAEPDVWEIFNRIIAERKRREIDPTIVALSQYSDMIRESDESGAEDALRRVENLREFFEAMDRFHQRFTPHSKADVDQAAQLVKINVEGLS